MKNNLLQWVASSKASVLTLMGKSHGCVKVPFVSPTSRQGHSRIFIVRFLSPTRGLADLNIVAGSFYCTNDWSRWTHVQ
jgi:hypothetical protein